MFERGIEYIKELSPRQMVAMGSVILAGLGISGQIMVEQSEHPYDNPEVSAYNPLTWVATPSIEVIRGVKNSVNDRLDSLLDKSDHTRQNKN